ncbi:hypothetical protein [Empedobacter sp. GD03739]|uniref:hypothetical protein n=1 Tax=Empedobacter sp. GD03739 TaxID=2975376 RepID=UPI0024474CAE|nr:hypothetical protein [Empedobacter sp. GD03739]MDH1602339.1 hypothetical protein [Empedobacter sp. GD03739]
MNILELNQKLYETLESLESGKIDAKKADSIVNVANAITNNTKLLLNVAKTAKSQNIAQLLLGAETANEIEYRDIYEQKTEFALSLGYDNLSSAIGKLGKENFEQKFKNRKI